MGWIYEGPMLSQVIPTAEEAPRASPEPRVHIVPSKKEVVMIARSRPSAVILARTLLRVTAVAGVALTLDAPAYAQDAAAPAARKQEPIVYTVDVAEDLAGKLVPTFVKPE